MPAALRLTPAQLALVDAYVASLQAVGIQIDRKALWPARAFGARVGSPEDWARLSLEAQCALPLRIRHFVSWLIVTQRVATSAAYVVVGPPILGGVALRHQPGLAQALLRTATSLGLPPARDGAAHRGDPARIRLLPGQPCPGGRSPGRRTPWPPRGLQAAPGRSAVGSAGP